MILSRVTKKNIFQKRLNANFFSLKAQVKSKGNVGKKVKNKHKSNSIKTNSQAINNSSFKLRIIIQFYNIKSSPTTNLIQSTFKDMDQFDHFDSDSQSYIYQSSNDDMANGNFLYQDSCVFLHDYKDDHSCQEELLPKFTDNHQESQESQLSIASSQAYDETVTQREETEKTTSNHFKSKIIQKPPKKKTSKSKTQNQGKAQKSKPKKIGNPSRFNNFGGFLIGSLAEILLKARACRILNGDYQIFESGQFVPIFQSNFLIEYGNSDTMMAIIRKLKREVEQLPRKQGAKKHLFRLINKGAKDNQERKECKAMIRQQLIYHLSQQAWLINHVNSRDFQPKGDDAEGTKKKERHEAYLIYLQAIRQALMTKEQLPKRLAL